MIYIIWSFIIPPIYNEANGGVDYETSAYLSRGIFRDGGIGLCRLRQWSEVCRLARTDHSACKCRPC